MPAGRDLDALQTLVAVADGGSFAAAAQRLGLSDSMVGRRIAALEQRLRCRLVHRTTRGLSLTEAGAAFAERCRALLAAYDAALDELAGRDEQAGGLLRVTAPASLGGPLMAPVLQTLLQAHPALQVELRLDEHRRDLVSGGFDVAVRLGPLPDSRLVARRLATLQGRLVGSPDYLARHGEPADPAALAGHAVLDHDPLHSGLLWGVALQPRLRADSFELLARLAEQGLGLATLPDWLWRDPVAAGRLRLLLPQRPAPTFELYAVTPPAPRWPARVRVRVEALAMQAHELSRLGRAP
jgi:DNA-binding transcriptional LysR family regulator